MCNFIKSNGEQCKLARNKERCGKHPIIMDQEIIVAESNIVEEMPPQVSTPVVAEVVDTPAPSVIEPVESSNIEVSKVPELDESIVAPAVTENVVYREEYNSELKKLYNSDDEYDTDDEDEYIPTTTKLASSLRGSEPIRAVKRVDEIRDDSWMYESSDDSCSDDGSIVWDEPSNEHLNEAFLEEFERTRQAEEYAEYEDASQEDVTSPPIEIVNPTKPKANTKTDKYTKEITSEDEIKETILKKIVDDMMLLDKDLIRECNKVDLYDLSSLRNVTIDVSKLALLIRQTLVRTDNNGLPMWYGKNNTKLRFGEEEVDAIEFSPVGKVFQTYKMAISYKYSPKFKPVVAHLKMSVILDAVTHLVNHKSADVHPYGPFDAHKNDPRVFNLFSGFPHVYDPKYEINQERVDVWLDHIRYVLSDSNDAVYQFFVKYFAHLIQKPPVKTKMVPLIKGTQGCGKNSAFDIFHRFVIGPQSSLVCPSMERITARFNSIRQSKLSIVLDEAFDLNNRSMNNQMKSYITDDRTQIERKGLETIEVNDYANYVILTNNDFGSIIEANDRRYMCLVASESRVGDEKYYDHYFDTLANLDAGRDIFHYLARVDLTGFKPQAFPLTKYKKELKTKQTNNVVKWLINMHEKLSVEEDDEIKEASTSEWYGKYCSWAETSGESRIMSLNVFSGLLKNEGIDTEAKNIVDCCGKRLKFRYRTISRHILEVQLAQYIE